MDKRQRLWLQSSVPRRSVSWERILRVIDADLASFCEQTIKKAPMTQEQLCKLMRVVAPETALALIHGAMITDSDTAVSFLKDKGLDHLVVNNSAEVEVVINRRADLSVFFDMIHSGVCLWRFDMRCSWADMAELQSTSLRDTDACYRVADGDSTWKFIKSIGVTNTNRFGDELLPLEGVFTPAQIKAMIQRADKPNDPLDLLTRTKHGRLSNLIWIAKRIGVSKCLSLRHHSTAVLMAGVIKSELDASGYEFMDEFVHSASLLEMITPSKWNYSKAHAYHCNGFSVTEALSLLDQGVDVNRAVAIRDGKIPSAVSSGWL